MNALDRKTIETIRFLAADGVQKANSGHPGLPMGTATMAFALWKEFLRGSATDPTWADRDRFVLSAGHGSMLLYALLHLFGYEVSLDDLKQFRQMGSITPGHPEYGMTPGVETTTGPLGQGVSNAVGFAIAERHLAAKFNKVGHDIVDHFTYVIAGDGDLMEGVASEACSLAGHLKLGRLIVLYDDNNITIDGGTDKSFTEDVGKRFSAYGWEVLSVDDGNDYESVVDAIQRARLNTTQPTLIKVKTIIGYGSPNKAGTSGVHGSPLGDDELRLTKERFGWDPDRMFYVPEEVRDHMNQLIDKREIDRFMWEEKLETYFESFPEMQAAWEVWHEYELPEELLNAQGVWKQFSVDEASRASGGRFLNLLNEKVPNLIGGSADLNASTKTFLKGGGVFDWDTPGGKNIYFGVREHAMAAILNGIGLHGGLRPFGSTFLVFSDYMKPSIRLSALMKNPVLYVFTHDSIGVGEDGPTHQPIEHLMMLRSIPGLRLFRPGDSKETAVAWIEAMKYMDGPSAIILTRQKLKCLEGVHKGAHYGGYILHKESGDHPELIMLATGSEVNPTLEAAKRLEKDGVAVRVVSMLSWELFEDQPDLYKEDVLPPQVEKRIAVEAGIKLGWERYVGPRGKIIAMESFGECAPGDEVMDHFGFTADKIEQQARELLTV